MSEKSEKLRNLILAYCNSYSLDMEEFREGIKSAVEEYKKILGSEPKTTVPASNTKSLQAGLKDFIATKRPPKDRSERCAMFCGVVFGIDMHTDESRLLDAWNLTSTDVDILRSYYLQWIGKPDKKYIDSYWNGDRDRYEEYQFEPILDYISEAKDPETFKKEQEQLKADKSMQERMFQEGQVLMNEFLQFLKEERAKK